jgi:hypothetical protein
VGAGEVILPLSIIILSLVYFSVFKMIGRDYSVFLNFPDRLATSLGWKGIIPRYLKDSLGTSIFLARFKTLHHIHHSRVFLK